MRAKLAAAAVCGLFVLSGLAQAAELRVLASGAIKDVAEELFPQFEKASGSKVVTTWAGTVDIKKRVAAGEQFDLVIVGSPEVDAFTKEGKFAPGNKVDLVKSLVGVAVRAGAPKPAMKNGDDLKKALLAAKSVAYSTGPSGVHMQKVFETMGIADQIKAKAKVAVSGVRVGTLVGAGEAEIGFQQVSELVHEHGIDFLGPIPDDVQNVTVYSSAVPVGAQTAAEAKALQNFLTTPAIAPIIKKHGLEQVQRAASAS